jgi:thiol:disulfide interchange protein DsbA
MNKIFYPVLASLLACAACGKDTAPAPAQPAEAPPPAETAAAPPAAEPAPAPAAEAARESDGESVEAAVSTTSPIASAVSASTPAPASGNLERWKQGENFTAYPVAQPVSTPPGKVEVIEAFWYGCGHCYSLEPRVAAWDESKPDWIELKRLPVVWNEVTREDARLFLTIESLGLADKLHGEVFREIHVNHRPITVVRGGRVDAAATEQSAREFLTARGVSAEDFAKHYRSFSTENRLRQTENLSRRYLLDHTPMMIVHGKYLTDVQMAGGQNELFELVGDLAAREREAG